MSTAAATTERWDRRRLVRTLLIVAVTGLALLGGLAYAIYSAVTSAGRTQPPAAAAGRAAAQLPPGADRRDAIAAVPMLAVPPEASVGGTPAATPALTITIPSAGKVGPDRVPSGFPRTPEGAVGQLAAIETTVLQAMSINQAHAVYRQWSVAGAPPAERWEMVASIQGFLGSAAGGYADDLTTAVLATPVAARVKGTDGPDWVLACVLLDVKAKVVTAARIAYGHCSRMEWTASEAGRWVIGSGPPPARAPSTWPGTDLARHAGWRTWVSEL